MSVGWNLHRYLCPSTTRAFESEHLRARYTTIEFSLYRLSRSYKYNVIHFGYIYMAKYRFWIVSPRPRERDGWIMLTPGPKDTECRWSIIAFHHSASFGLVEVALKSSCLMFFWVGGPVRCWHTGHRTGSVCASMASGPRAANFSP